MNRSSGLKSPENLVLEPAGRTGSLTWLRFETRLGFFTKAPFFPHYNTTYIRIKSEFLKQLYN